MTAIDAKTIQSNEYPVEVRVRSHVFTADASLAAGGQDTGLGAHDLFDSSLSVCKAHTAMWYAKRKAIPLERVEVHVESDNTKEREGVYKLRVRVELFGPLTDEQRADVQRAIAKCPIHKLMTTTDVEIETVE